jgi:hypothetical protein
VHTGYYRLKTSDCFRSINWPFRQHKILLPIDG